jgi:carbonic anhydrase
MRPSASARTLLLAGLLACAAPAPARAQQPPADPAQLRDRIARDVADGLARHTARITPAPAVANSRPVPIGPRARTGHEADSTARLPVAASDTSADGVWNELLAGNQRFVSGRPLARPLAHERAELADSQQPRTVVLGSADSRVSPELVFDQSLGDLFVVRTAGNIVDPIALGSIEYAVEHLHARLLVVLGHSNCGAVRAAASEEEMPSAYLQAIVDRIRPTVQRLSPCFEGEELIERSVIANARQSAADVLSNSALLRDATAKGRLKVVSAVYDLRSGVVTPVSLSAATAQAQAPAR